MTTTNLLKAALPALVAGGLLAAVALPADVTPITQAAARGRSRDDARN